MSSSEKILAQKEALEFANAILNKRLGVIEGARNLCKPLFLLNIDLEPEFVVFKACDSETDHLYLGKNVSRLHQDAIKRNQDEVDQFETLYRERIFSASHKLVKFLKSKIC